jgi:hypothetical protein
VILRNVQIGNGKDIIKVDIGINLDEIDGKDDTKSYFRSQVVDLGDLSVFYGYNDIDLDGYKIQKAKTYTNKTFLLNELNNLNLYDIYAKGCSNIIVANLTDENFYDLPINLTLSNKIDATINLNEPANFILIKNGKIEYIVVNGYPQKVEQNRKFEGNGIAIR